MEETGLHPIISSSVNDIYDLVYLLEYYVSNGEISIGIDEYTATFLVDNRKEYKRISEYGQEREIIELIISTLSTDDVFWDIGANIGLYSIFSAKQVQQGAVVAFEPHPQNYESLRRNIKQNDLSNISAEKIALANENTVGVLTLEDTEAGAGGNTLESKHRSDDLFESSQEIDIIVRQGDMILEKDIPFPNVIKIDVEGAELDTIKGMETILSDDKCREVFCEVHKHYSVSPENYEDLMSELGFESSIIRETSIQTFFYSRMR